VWRRWKRECEARSLRLGESAFDDPAADAPRLPRHEEHRTLGFAFDLGVPDGVALAMEVHPAVDWVRLAAAVTYNGAAPGALTGSISTQPMTLTHTLHGHMTVAVDEKL
jgi:hypothetical protein